MSWFYPELDNLRLPQLVRGDQNREPSFGDAVVETYILGAGVPKGNNLPYLVVIFVIYEVRLNPR